MKLVDCKRCNGKGIGNWHVIHLGVPGLCYACDGCGQQAKLTMEERVQLFIAAKESHLKELEDEAARIKEIHSHGRQSQFRTNRLEENLERLRETYRAVKKELKAVELSKKVTAQQQAATISANSIPAILKG